VIKIYKVKDLGRQPQLNFMALLRIFNAQHVSAQVQKAMISQN